MKIMYLIVLIPILSFFILYFFKQLLPYKCIVTIGVGSIFLSTIIIGFITRYFINNNLFIFIQNLCSWFYLENYNINFCFLLDDLSLIFIVMIICIGLIVSIFSIWYMQNKNNVADFFAFINLFLANMLILVLSDNFITMYLGWEGVSVCSYLLINFYYYKSYVSRSAMKSFIITKIGDLFLISSILTIYMYYHTLNFYDIQFLIKIHIIKYKFILNIVTILLLFGALGKSAQIPLQIWLPTAMVGPTPVSALIHAATMVTAGIYIIIRNHDLFLLTPNILYFCGIIGSITLLISSISAIFQTDIKRILAYSTMSQLGLMFISLSIGAWYAAIVHLITHAIFKALLFLSAGALILQCNNEKNIFFMGNKLWKKFPFLYCCFLVGGSSLSAIPLITSGFYSKGNILFYIFGNHNIFFLTIMFISTLLTTIYVYRLIFIVFHTQSNIFIKKNNFSYLQLFPLLILLIFSTCFEKIFIPNLSHSFPYIQNINNNYKIMLELFSSILVIFGFFISYYLYYIKIKTSLKIFKNLFFFFLSNIFFNGFYFYKIYKILFIIPYIKISKYLYHNSLDMLKNYFLIMIKRCNTSLLYIEYSSFHFYIKIMIFSMIMMTFFILYAYKIFNYLKLYE